MNGCVGKLANFRDQVLEAILPQPAATVKQQNKKAPLIEVPSCFT
jgi:hypothetical protein